MTTRQLKEHIDDMSDEECQAVTWFVERTLMLRRFLSVFCQDGMPPQQADLSAGQHRSTRQSDGVSGGEQSDWYGSLSDVC